MNGGIQFAIYFDIKQSNYQKNQTKLGVQLGSFPVSLLILTFPPLFLFKRYWEWDIVQITGAWLRSIDGFGDYIAGLKVVVFVKNPKKKEAKVSSKPRFSQLYAIYKTITHLA